MIIKTVETAEEAKVCDELLTKLIIDEKNYNDNISMTVGIVDFYTNMYKKDNCKLFIAVEDNKIVGYIYVKLLGAEALEIQPSAMIDALYVEEDYRNKGIATSLISKAKEYCRDNKVNNITIRVFDKNEKAKNLYMKEGFNIDSLTLKYKSE